MGIAHRSCVVGVLLLGTTALTESDARRRMLREAPACGRLNHPNMVQVLDVGTSDDGSPFLVMELLQGEPLADRLANGLPP